METRPKMFLFQETKLEDGSFETQLDFLQRFRVEPKVRNFGKDHSRSTIACMDFKGVLYFVKNGKHHDTADGFIQGTYWAEQAEMLSKHLGSRHNPFWFQYTEPQLMALYVNRYIYGKNMLFADFGDSSTPKLDMSRSRPLVVPIYVSHQICGVYT
jgi:hypothetical protein